MTDARAAFTRAANDMGCCDVCRWACGQTGVEGADALTRPWVISPVRDLVEGDTIREWGDGPHLRATISIRDGRVFALWQDGDHVDVHELHLTVGASSGSVIRMLRTVEVAR